MRGLEIEGKFIKFTAIGVYLEEAALPCLAAKWKGKTAEELADSVEFFRDIVTGTQLIVVYRYYYNITFQDNYHNIQFLLQKWELILYQFSNSPRTFTSLEEEPLRGLVLM